jgi:hypothetical protein
MPTSNALKRFLHPSLALRQVLAKLRGSASFDERKLSRLLLRSLKANFIGEGPLLGLDMKDMGDMRTGGVAVVQ